MYREIKRDLDLAHYFNRAKDKPQEREYLQSVKKKVEELLRG
jgi:hypothetical protein